MVKKCSKLKRQKINCKKLFAGVSNVLEELLGILDGKIPVAYDEA